MTGISRSHDIDHARSRTLTISRFEITRSRKLRTGMKGLNPLKLISLKRISLLLGGLVLLSALIGFRGPSLIGSQVAGIGPVYGLVLGLSLIGLLFRTFSWKIALGRSRISFLRLFRLNAGGEALNAISSILPLRGDTLNFSALRAGGEANPPDSIVIDRGIRRLAGFLFLWPGLALGAFFAAPLPNPLRLGIAFLALAGGGFCVGAVFTAPSGLFAPVIRRIRALPLPFLPSPAVLGQCEEIDRLLLRFFNEKRVSFYSSLLLHLVAQGLFTAEIFLIGRALLPDFSVPLALVLTATAPLASRFFPLIPGAFGLLEILFAVILGLAFGGAGCSAGISLQLVRRIRALFWVIVGFVIQGNPLKAFSR